MEKGLIHVYCGDGKGKTSAAIGLAVRAAGRNLRVLFVRFLKNEDSGELNILNGIPQIEVTYPEHSYGFYKTLNDLEKAEMHDMYLKYWDQLMSRIEKEHFDVLVMDEFMAAYSHGLIRRERAVSFLRRKQEDLEVILTGRNPADEILNLADYVSEIQKVRHPFDRGVSARKGIEY